MSRASGDVIEYTMAYHACSKGLYCNSPQRMIKLEKTFLESKMQVSDQHMKNLDSVYKETLQGQPKSFTLAKDNEGKTGSSYDIMIECENGEKVPFSVKKNNHAVKHQRPSNLFGEVVLRGERDMSLLYRNEYSTLNEKWCRKIKEMNVLKYREISAETRTAMLTEFSQLYADYVRKIISARETSEMFLRFLLGDSHYMLYVTKSGKMKLYDMRSSEIHCKSKVLDLEVRLGRGKVRQPRLYMTLESGLQMYMRLHTASEHVPRTSEGSISIKFDTRIVRLQDHYPLITWT
jgi:hypothetical protein